MKSVKFTVFGILCTSIGLLTACCVTAQVCSPPGQLCTRTSDCCKGCCEAHTCVDRPFSCSPDLVPQPGFNSCERYYCPLGHICYLREICPPENPCPPHPQCRRVDSYNYTDHVYSQPNSAGSQSCYYSFTALVCVILVLL